MSGESKHLVDIEAARIDSDEDYVNPAHNSPRWLLRTQAFFLRLAACVGFKLGNYAVPSPTQTIWLDSTLGERSGKQTISVDVWVPPVPPGTAKRPAVINFHGGGFILGSGTDDGRWAQALVHKLGAVVFSVNYRLAPNHPYPTPVEDCVDAIIQICELAGRYNFDTDRIILSGFSAGGNLATSSWLVMQDPARWNYNIPLSLNKLPRIAGLVLYYPPLDWTIDRPQKRITCKHPDLTLPTNLTDLIDASYIYPPLLRRHRDEARLSPGLMSDEMIDQLPPVHLCLCEHDMLLAEGKAFADRLKNRGRRVCVRIVEGEKHAWDKPRPLSPKPTVVSEYDSAIASVRSWFGGL
ncbi:Alpha/Beta hydrolase protein [Xylaria nigripes]|nr:Alpha/Beta hydrolase protein [Xylaria nigripes]